MTAQELHGCEPSPPTTTETSAVPRLRAVWQRVPSQRYLQAAGRWTAYVFVALVCGKYLDNRAALIPKWGEWWAADPHDYITLQVRAFLAGRLALFKHPGAALHDYFWGRGGMHTAWGLGVPILAIPFHLVGRLFGSPGCPDSVRFLLLYVMTAVVLARAIHGLSRYETSALGASCLAAAFVVTYPTYVGLVASRFKIYEQTIATGALWALILLAGIFALLRKCTPTRLALVCAAAGFIVMLRVTLCFYGPPTVVIALLIAHRRGLRPRSLVAGGVAYIGSAAMYFVSNILRFGGPLNSGYDTCLCSALANRITRWGLPFARTPLSVAAKEMFATFFLLDPVSSQVIGSPPAEVAKYAVGERWREYYAPTFDLWALALWGFTLAIFGWRFVRGRLWQRDSDLAAEVPAVIAAWAIPPSLLLFVFYSKMSNWCTRYATDLYPAFAACGLSFGMFLVSATRKRAPSLTSSVQLALAGAAALYTTGWQGWATHLSHPVDVNTVIAQTALSDARGAQPPHAPNHYRCGEPRGLSPVYTNLDEWRGDCTFASGMVFALRYSPCVTFTFGPASGEWGPGDDEAVRHLRLNGDFDHYKMCGAPSVFDADRQVTMCESGRPPFLLDGMRLYTIGTLDEGLRAIDRLKLLQIETSNFCP